MRKVRTWLMTLAPLIAAVIVAPVDGAFTQNDEPPPDDAADQASDDGLADLIRHQQEEAERARRWQPITRYGDPDPMVDIDGDLARLRMYMKAEHFLRNDQGGMDFTIGGYYDDRLVRTGEGWKMQAVTLNVFWSRGNRQIMALAAEIGKRKLEEAASAS